ncbi:hypothetical protein CALVIDRAFT_537770 [Calocera viscosa TUFC12733]|uniref:Uncharacterized protein n=1 Tax=Calocera viscosa (strain TUFC12733) TaxID=1330018 RepID=A0A167LKT2_CALVF|nr:hypothetical protein CALVIDRAFT_537770 [Calocera viscosa TUFC12733]
MATRPRPQPLTALSQSNNGPQLPTRASKALSLSLFKPPPSPLSPSYPTHIPLSHPALSPPPANARTDLPNVWIVPPPESGAGTVLAFDSRAPPSPNTPDLALLEETVALDTRQRDRERERRLGPPPDIGIPKFRRLTERQMRMEGVVMPRRRDTAPSPQQQLQMQMQRARVRRSETDPLVLVPTSSTSQLSLSPRPPGIRSPRLPPSPPPNMPLPPLPLPPRGEEDNAIQILQGGPAPAPPRRIGSPPPALGRRGSGLGIYAPPPAPPGTAPVQERGQGQGQGQGQRETPPLVPFPSTSSPTDISPPAPAAPPPPAALPSAAQQAQKHISISIPPTAAPGRDTPAPAPAPAAVETKARKRSSTLAGLRRRSGFFSGSMELEAEGAKAKEQTAHGRLEKAAEKEKENAKEKEKEGLEGKKEAQAPETRRRSVTLGARRRSLFFSSPPAVELGPAVRPPIPHSPPAPGDNDHVLAKGDSSQTPDAPAEAQVVGEPVPRPPRTRSQSEKGLKRPRSIMGFAGLMMGNRTVPGTPVDEPGPGVDSPTTTTSSIPATPVAATPPTPTTRPSTPSSLGKEQGKKEKEKEKRLRRPKSLMGLGRHFTVPLKGGEEVPPVPALPPPQAVKDAAPADPAKKSNRKSFYNLSSLSLSHHRLHKDPPAPAELPGVRIDGVPHALRKPVPAPGEEGGKGRLRRPKSLAGLGAFMLPQRQALQAAMAGKGAQERPGTASTTESGKRPGTASTVASVPRPPTASSTSSTPAKPPTPSRPAPPSTPLPPRPGTAMSDRSPPAPPKPAQRVRTYSLTAPKRISTLFALSGSEERPPPVPCMPMPNQLPTIPSVRALPELDLDLDHELPQSQSRETLKTPVTPSFPSPTRPGILTSTPLSSESSPVSEPSSSPSLTSDSVTDEADADGSTDRDTETETGEETAELDVDDSSPCTSAYDSAKEDCQPSPGLPNLNLNLKLGPAPFQGLGIDMRSFGVRGEV